MGRDHKLIRWTLHAASMDFDLDDKTLSKNIRTSGVSPGEDGCFSTADICKAVFGDLRGDLIRAQTRDADASAKIREVKLACLQHENIPAASVERVLAGVMIELRQKIQYAPLPDPLKQEILRDLQTIPIEQYFTNANASIEEPDKESSSPT
jgi:hypothetical protein